MTTSHVILLVVTATFVALVALARRWRTYPHQPLVLLVLIPAILALGLIISGALLSVLLALNAALLLMAIGDLLSLPRQGQFTVQRDTLRVASLKKSHPVAITIVNRGARSESIWIRDGLPPPLAAEPIELSLRLGPRSRATLRYQLRASRRGAFSLTQIYLRVRSRLGLWQRFLIYPAESLIHVYPDMKQLGEYTVLARTNRLSLLGVRRTRKIGQDNEFERLRDFTRDDNYKHIHWRSTARRNKLTVKDFQASQSQRLLFLVDCGRMMASEASGLSLVDHALNAMLMLSYVALRQGDSVGLISFSDSIHSFVPPLGGMNQMNRLLHASFNRFPRLVESRYDEAFLYLAARCRKRAMVVLVTNVIDEVNAGQIDRYLSSLTGRSICRWACCCATGNCSPRPTSPRRRIQRPCIEPRRQPRF